MDQKRPVVITAALDTGNVWYPLAKCSPNPCTNLPGERRASAATFAFVAPRTSHTRRAPHSFATRANCQRVCGRWLEAVREGAIAIRAQAAPQHRNSRPLRARRAPER